MAPEMTAQGSIRRFTILTLVLVALATGTGWIIGKWRTEPGVNPTQDKTATAEEIRGRGQMIYTLYCANCHGPEGHGDGPSAATLRSRPRDFAARPWRFPMTAESIRSVTLEGIPGTGMTAFRATLSGSDLDAVTDYVLSLANLNSSVEKPMTEEERLLKDAGFVSLSCTAPPPLTLSDSTSRTLRLNDFPGQLLLLHFWGTNCTHCIKEIPELSKLERDYPGRLKVLHICTDEEDPISAQKILDRQTPGVTAWTETHGIGLSAYEVQTLPTVWLIGLDGKTIGRTTGAKDWASDNLRKLLKHWLPAQKPQSTQSTK